MLLAAVSILATTGASLNSAYLLVGLVVGIIAIVGGLVPTINWLRKSGVREKNLDDVIIAVLGDPDSNPPKLSRFDQIDVSLAKFSPNGLNTDNIGDMVKRIENTTDRLETTQSLIHTQLDTHMGESQAIHTNLQRQLDSKQDKVVA